MPFEPSSPRRRPAAVLCDAMGTVLQLDRPVPRLRAALAARGIQVTEDEAAAALSAEVRWYRAHHLEGRDAASVDALRRRCADVLRAALPAALDGDRAHAALMEALRFTVLEGTRPALDRLRAAGMRVALVSNWDASLEETLAGLGLRGHVDAVVTSAEAGAAKPDPAPLRLALERLGARAEDSVMVGDDEVDVTAARALGMPAALVAPAGGIAAVVDELLAIPA